MELEDVLNKTEQGQRVYASYWRNPVLLKTCSDVYDFFLLGINILTILVFGIVFICQQRQLVRIQAMIVVLQTRRVPQAVGLDLFRVLSTTAPTEALGKSQSELIVKFGNTYWLILFGLFVVLSGLYKAWHLCCRWWPKKVSKKVTRSLLTLHIFDGDYGVYISLLEVDDFHSQLVITSGGIIDNLVLLGCIIPVVTYTWSVSVQNNITGVITCPGLTAHVTLSQAWRFCRLMTCEFRTEVYLLTEELRVVRSEGGTEEQAENGLVEYTSVHSPRGGSAMGGVNFFVPTVSKPASIFPITVEARPISPATTVVWALSPPTRLPLVVAADVHKPMGERSLILSEGAISGAIGRQSTSFDRRLLGRHSDRALPRFLPRNSDGADDRLC